MVLVLAIGLDLGSGVGRLQPRGPRASSRASGRLPCIRASSMIRAVAKPPGRPATGFQRRLPLCRAPGLGAERRHGERGQPPCPAGAGRRPARPSAAAAARRLTPAVLATTTWTPRGRWTCRGGRRSRRWRPVSCPRSRCAGSPAQWLRRRRAAVASARTADLRASIWVVEERRALRPPGPESDDVPAPEKSFDDLLPRTGGILR